jgi:hypothetical protein
MLLLQDGPEAVFEHDVTSRKAEEHLEWLRDCQILKNTCSVLLLLQHDAKHKLF